MAAISVVASTSKMVFTEFPDLIMYKPEVRLMRLARCAGPQTGATMEMNQSTKTASAMNQSPITTNQSQSVNSIDQNTSSHQNSISSNNNTTTTTAAKIAQNQQRSKSLDDHQTGARAWRENPIVNYLFHRTLPESKSELFCCLALDKID